MVIEACEYRNAFLNYHPDIAVITNIDPDHLDFFKTEEAYFLAFQEFMGQARCVVMLVDEFLALEKREERREQRGGFFDNCKTRIIVHPTYFEVIGEPFNYVQPGKYPYTLPTLLVPGDHIRLDASLAYVVSQLL